MTIHQNAIFSKSPKIAFIRKHVPQPPKSNNKHKRPNLMGRIRTPEFLNKHDFTLLFPHVDLDIRW